MDSEIVYVYQWHYEEVDEVTVIHIFGLNKNNESVYIKVKDFTPYVYLELPTDINWDANMAKLVTNYFDKILGISKPIKKRLMRKKRLYYANKKLNKNGEYEDVLFPYLFMTFSRPSDIRTLSFKIRNPVNFPGIGNLKFKIHESDASPILQLTCLRDIPTAGWVEIKGEKIADKNKESLCEHEFDVKYQNISKYESDSTVRPLLMGMDIEVNSSNPNVMPNNKNPKDKVFQISCVFARQGCEESSYEKYILSLGNPDQKVSGEDVKILSFKTEGDLLEGYVELIQTKNPQIIIGYNIFKFDIPYMMERSNLTSCTRRFYQQGCLDGKMGTEKKIKWSSAAYGNQEFQFLDCEGRLFVDLFPLVQRDYKFDTYSLKAVSTHFLGQTKDDLPPKGIFKCYRDFTPKSLGVCAKYCVKDSLLVVKLFELLKTWIGLCEMAKTCNVPIFYTYTQGQQIKIYSQVYKKCLLEGYVVEKDGYVAKESERYTGAYVFDPHPGLYDNIVSFDFSSLYPTTIIAYNIDYTTLVLDESIPDEKCHVFDWEDHFGCSCDQTVRKTKIKKEDMMCEKRHFRFLKEPKGVIPTLLENLLGARKLTNKQIAGIEEKLKDVSDEIEKEELKTLITVLDKRQLAYKVSANSMYGAMGVRRGYLPFIPGAMCTTAKGRQSIEKAAKHLQNVHKAKLVYGDSCTGDTPIILNKGGEIKLQTFLDFEEKDWKGYRGFKSLDIYNQGIKNGDLTEEWKKPDGEHMDKQQIEMKDKDVKIWTHRGWAKVNRVIRHHTDKKIYRVLTHNGCVDVTEDHSLLDKEVNQIKPRDCQVGMELLHSYPELLQENKKNITKEEAFVYGFFVGDGSCGTYDTKYGIKYTWALNNKDLDILNKCKEYLESSYQMKFKILNTIESSGVYKLVPVGKIKDIVIKYRKDCYNQKCKIVPEFILDSDQDIRNSFLEGLYASDGCRSDTLRVNCHRIDTKNKITAQSYYMLLKGLGFNVSINDRKDKPNIFRLTWSINKQRKGENVIKKIYLLHEKYDDYVYDIETEFGVFHAGIGSMIIKNTDSTYVYFPDVKGAQNLWNHSLNVEEEVSSLFPRPMKLAFEEKIYWRYFILTKKRYMALKCDLNDQVIRVKNKETGELEDDIFKRGVLLTRRDNSKWLQGLYKKVVMKIFYREDKNEVLNLIIDSINDLFYFKYSFKNFVITKSIKEKEDYKIKELPTDEKKRVKRLKDLNCTEDEFLSKSYPAHIQLAERMRRRGKRVDAGTRLEYLVTTNGGWDGRSFDKIEDFEYFKDHSELLRVDYLYYLHLAINPLDEAVKVAYDISGFVDTQYKLRVVKHKICRKIEEVGRSKIEIIE